MDYDKLRILALYLLYRRHKRRRCRNRSYWVHPINQVREEAGTSTALQDLREDEDKFFDYFRMSSSSFDELHERIKSEIKRVNTNMRSCIPSEERLAVTLRYLATGCSFGSLHHTFRMGVSTIRNIVKEVCEAIWTVLGQEAIPNLTKERLGSIANGFEKTANFPHCLGAVGGKHIRLIGVSTSKGTSDHHSVALIAVADTKYRFVHINVKTSEYDCDTSFFKQSTLWKSVQSNELQPDQKCLPGTDNSRIPYVFVGDKSFGLHQHLMRPYAGTNMTPEKKIFNYRLQRAQRYVDCAFGILSNKWQIVQTPINVSPEFAVDIARACFVLHNFVLERDGFLDEDAMTIAGLEDLEEEDPVRGGLEANSVRDSLKKYFVTSAGAVHWQNAMI